MVRKKQQEKPSNSNISQVKKADNKAVVNVNNANNANSEVKQEEQKAEYVEIPIGKVFSGLKMDKMRENPWILSSIVLGIVLVIVLITSFNGVGGGITGDVVADDVVGQKILDLAKQSLGNDVQITSVDRKNDYYEVILESGGQPIPVLVSLDGKYILQPLSETESSDTTDTTSEQVTNINYQTAPVKGDVNAEVTIVEFSDYQCPFCGKFYLETLGQLDTNYIKTGRVKLVYMDFPLNSIHPEAQKAAEAARCVGEQKGDEGYYRMHNKLFESQTQLSISNYKKWAKELGANSALFDKCLDDGKYASAVNADLSYGYTLGVSGTPAFFIGNEEIGYTTINGAQPYSAFQQIIEGQLAG